MKRTTRIPILDALPAGPTVARPQPRVYIIRPPHGTVMAPEKETVRKRAPVPRGESRGVVGWREWVSLPELGIGSIKAKIDTGARSSSLHAYDMKRFRRRGVSMIRFKVHPIQRETRTVVEAEAVLVDLRKVRSSSGVQTLRPVIVTRLGLGGQAWDIEITLVRRDAMGFRMLLGRQAIRGHLVVDAGRSFVASTRPSRPASRAAEDE